MYFSLQYRVLQICKKQYKLNAIITQLYYEVSLRQCEDLSPDSHLTLGTLTCATAKPVTDFHY